MAVAAGCSLTRPQVDECSTNADCRDAFGVGTACGSDGLCEKAAPNPRCNQTFPDDLLVRPENHPNTVVFGSLMDRSSGSQVQRENAVRLAAMQLTDQGGYDGKNFGIVFCDVAEDPKYDSLARTEAAVSAARHLVDAYAVPAIIGPSASPDALAVFEAVENDGVLVMSPAATSPELTSADVPVASNDAPGLLWRTAPPDSIQGLAIAKWFEQSQPSVTHVAVIYEQGPYGTGLKDVFVSAFATASETVDELPFANASARDTATLQAGASAAQAVLFFSSQTTDAAAFLIAADSSGDYAAKQPFLTDSAANSDFLSQAASATTLLPIVKGSRPELPDPDENPVYKAFVSSFNAAFKVDASQFSYVAHAYDAAWLVFAGSVWSYAREGALSGLGIARGLRRVTAGSNAFQLGPSAWAGIVDSFEAGTPIDLAGASGSLDFDSVTEETSSPIEIWQVAPGGDGFTVIDTIQ